MNLSNEKQIRETIRETDDDIIKLQRLLASFVDGGTLFRRKSRSLGPLLLHVVSNTDSYTKVGEAAGRTAD